MKTIAFKLLILVLLTQVVASPVFAQKSDESTPPTDTTPVVNEDSNLDVPDTVTDETDTNPVETSETTVDGKLDSPFDVEIIVGTQSPWNKRVPLIISVTPKIDATRTQITWDTRYGLEFSYNYDEFFPMANGVTQEFKAYVTPEEAGSYNISANVTDWGYGRNFTSSDDVSLKFGEDLVTIPETEGYQQSVIIRYVVIFIAIVIFIVVTVLLGKYAIVWLKEWLKPPQ